MAPELVHQPFSLWHCNDLWNLLPCSRCANHSKSDMLPERGLLMDRRSVVIDYWRILCEGLDIRFSRELAAFLGRERLGANWEGSAVKIAREPLSLPYHGDMVPPVQVRAPLAGSQLNAPVGSSTSSCASPGNDAAKVANVPWKTVKIAATVKNTGKENRRGFILEFMGGSRTFQRPFALRCCTGECGRRSRSLRALA